MKMTLTSLTGSGKKTGTVELKESVFGVPVRRDLLARMVNWQLAKRRAGTHKIKGRSEVAGSGAKLGRQKGGGRARHGNRQVGLFRGGGRAFGPVVRSHGHALPKKVRRLALCSALSARHQEGRMMVMAALTLKEGKTGELAKSLKKLGIANALFVGGAELDVNFSRAARNLVNIDVLPVQGINVYDILRRDVLVLSQEALESLEARLS